ncbi:MAG: hypothetical protein NC419_08610 [Muribaculaceae bacterium]|nr:hypothetical protein [Muribaculaceae bacterium]
MIVSHSIQTMNAIRLVNINIESYGKSSQRVSSGYQINRGVDNPVGLAISETMRRQVRGLDQGIQNTKAGINFCQIADGALSEVTNMLQRISGLAIQASNGTNITMDRHYIQAEISQILKEIDHISDTTAFNEIPVFKGLKNVVSTPATPTIPTIPGGDIPFEDFSIINLGGNPFESVTDGDSLALTAVVSNPSSPAYNEEYRMIFGNGSTSQSSFRLSYNDGSGTPVTRIIKMTNSTSSLGTGEEAIGNAFNYVSGQKADGTPYWKRDFEYTNADDICINITQEVTAHTPTDPRDEKKYNISYSFTNNSANNANVNLDFMFHADTAYNDNDQCEGYFINGADGNGSRLDKFCMFTDGGQWGDTLTGSATHDVTSPLPNSFSIIDVDNALAFSEKVSFVPGSEPNSLSIGIYSRIRNWSYYNSLNSNLGANAISQDLGFSLFWNKAINAGNTTEVSFNYGIVAVERDNNLNNIPIHRDPTPVPDVPPVEETETHRKIWIQSGYEKGSGIWLEIDDMDTALLGIRDLDVTTIQPIDENDEEAKENHPITRIKKALQIILDSRSKIGAQQNRLEHTVDNESSISDSVTTSESRLRDTDLSSEMIRYTNLRVMLQVGQQMIAESNKNIEKVLNLI